jgi:hypothetical protein
MKLPRSNYGQRTNGHKQSPCGGRSAQAGVNPNVCSTETTTSRPDSTKSTNEPGLRSQRPGNVTQESAGLQRPSATASPDLPGPPSRPHLESGGAGGGGLDPCLASAVSRQRWQQPRLSPAPAARTHDESARFHSKESPRPAVKYFRVHRSTATSAPPTANWCWAGVPEGARGAGRAERASGVSCGG